MNHRGAGRQALNQAWVLQPASGIHAPNSSGLDQISVPEEEARLTTGIRGRFNQRRVQKARIDPPLRAGRAQTSNT